MYPERLRPHSAPAGGELAVCPHCWHVNPYAVRLCGRCGADMTTALQESGGLRRMVPAQGSPLPVRSLRRLSPLQRLILLGMVVLFALAHLAVALAPRPPVTAAAAPVGE